MPKINIAESMPALKEKNDAEIRDKIKASIFSKQVKEAELLRELRAVRGEIEELRRELREG